MNSETLTHVPPRDIYDIITLPGVSDQERLVLRTLYFGEWRRLCGYRD